MPDLQKGSGNKGLHTSWPPPEAQSFHWWEAHAAAADWKRTLEATRLGVNIFDGHCGVVILLFCPRSVGMGFAIAFGSVGCSRFSLPLQLGTWC